VDSRLSIAVDAHNLLRDRRGIGVYLRALLARYVVREDLALTLLVRDLLPIRVVTAIASEIGSGNFAIARSVPRKASVVWHPWNGTFFAERKVPSAVTMHDVTPFAYPAADAWKRKREQAPFLRSTTAARILTDSQFSLEEITKHLGVERERLTVIPLAADARYVPGDAKFLPEALLDRPYILTVGANDPRKNLETLAAAHAAAFPSGEIALACVTSGAPPGCIEIRDAGFEMLRDLYRGALAYAIPSRYEGFGIPPLEAMRCGTPVLASRASSLPEVCGNAAYYVDAYDDVDAWRDALTNVVEDATLRWNLRQLGLARGQEFSWNRTADETLAALSSIAR
jgi:glycosyltransferase involved in cell wall biosynthesis